MGTRRILLLTDRDWTHPQGGGTGTHLYGHVSRWVAWGHHVTVIAGSYPGAQATEQLAPNLVVHRMGGRVTVFARAMAFVLRRRLARDHDVVVEVANGITFLTPLWLRRPRVTVIQHIHRDHYVAELGTPGKVAALVLETLPLRLLYKGGRFLTISQSAKDMICELGVAPEHVRVTYLGVEPPTFAPTPRATTQTLLYLGRLKQYKRIEILLDVLAACPDAHLHIAGDGDHRSVLEREIASRGLAARVTLHGHVSEAQKAELLSSAWVNLTASSAEGWCLTVMEAATYGTPSAALRVGGLAESIVDHETGLLADTPEQLAHRVRALLSDPQTVQTLGTHARERAATFRWEDTARTSLDLCEEAITAGRPALRQRLASSDTARVLALAGATLVANALSVIFTVVFARLLGADGYGALAALVSTFLILSVPGSALQVVVARETALGRFGTGDNLARTVNRWRRALLGGTVVAAAVGALLAEPIAGLLSVDARWAAAAVVPTSVLWLLISLERGVLQGVGAYRLVGQSIVLEAAGRIVAGLALVGAGLHVTGAYLGTPATLLATAVALALLGRQNVLKASFPGGEGTTLGRSHLRALVTSAWPALAALSLVAVLQNVDVILVRHHVGGDEAGAYAAASVAAKALIWVAVGIGLYVLPEATRRARDGQDPRPVLTRSVLVIAALAVPVLAVYAVFPETVLRLAFGPEAVAAADVLSILALAMTLLAAAYLCVQFMLGLQRRWFVAVLAMAAAAEVATLGLTDLDDLSMFAVWVLVLQGLVAAGVLRLGLAHSPIKTA